MDIKKLGNIAKISSGSTPSRNNQDFWNGDIPWVSTGELSSGFVNETREHVSLRAVHETSLKLLKPGTLLMAMYGQGKTRGIVAQLNITATTNQACASIEIKKDEPRYVYYVLQFKYDSIRRLSNGGSQENLSTGIIKEIQINLPPITEQRKIAEILSAQDRVIELKTKLLEEKKRLKKYLCQMLLSGKKRICDKYLEWDFYKLGNALSYEQPGKYIVRADNYKQSYCTPVLTAGKSFVLGYVNETDDVYQNVPVVIFDDFTTSSKYVDFPFKVKSSAIKILSANAGFDIYFMYEILQHIRYSISGHERHWISIFSKMEINLPCLREQREISKFLKTLNEEIDIYNDVIEKENLKKKALMQQLLTGKIRVKV